jgi:nifR3 family TIM-barrel protein
VLKLGELAVDPPLILAPMAGITDRDFRLAIRRLGGCGLVSMEFISSEAIVRSSPKTLQMMHFVEEERPIAIQVFGSDPAHMADAAALVQEIGADVCDINMGCPANKVLRGCAGAALSGDLRLAEQIVGAVRGRLTIPLTVKFRLGLSERELSYLELGRVCEAQGADAVTLHPRTARQQYSGTADWSHVARLKEALRIPVIGNGDVTRPADARQRMDESGCDAVMIGRASLTNPWIFRQAAAALRGEGMSEPSLAERASLILGHFSDVLRRDDERTALHKLRKFTGWYTHGLPDGRFLRRRLSELASAREVMEAVERYFDERSAA